MWLGISRGIHGYQDIDVDKAVTVRSEVARLTRLYERAVRSNTMNNPDMYLATGGQDGGTALRNRPTPAAPATGAGPSGTAAASGGAAPIAPALDPDEAPATTSSKVITKDSTPVPETPTTDSSSSAVPSAEAPDKGKEKASEDTSKPVADSSSSTVPPAIEGSVPIPNKV